MIKNRKNVFRILGIILFIGVSNIPIVSFLIDTIASNRSILYGSKYQFISGKNGFNSEKYIWTTEQELLNHFSEYKKTSPADTVLYRSFIINPLKFWLWRDYMVLPYYRYPYKSNSAILTKSV